MQPPSDTTVGTYIAQIVDGKFATCVPVNADVLVEACDALGRAAEKINPQTKTHERLVALHNIFFDFLCAVRHAEGPEPLTSPLRKDTP